MNRLGQILYRLLIWIGGAALFAAVFIGAIAVVGRHTGHPLLGAIEVAECAVLVSGAIGILIATLAGVHARVHLLQNRLAAGTLAALDRLAALLAAAFFLLLALGSIRIYLDLRAGFEESELLHLPYWPLRMLTILVVTAASVVYVLRAVRGRRS